VRTQKSGVLTLHDGKGSSWVDKCGIHRLAVIFESLGGFPGRFCGLDRYWLDKGAGALDPKWLIVLIALGAFVLSLR